jgi:hypothetical protein
MSNGTYLADVLPMHIRSASPHMVSSPIHQRAEHGSSVRIL